MPTLPPIGRADNPDDLDFEPLTVPIVGYTLDKEEVITEIRFFNSAPPGYAMDMIKSIDAKGRVNHVAALKFADGCVYPEDREKWNQLIHGEEVIITEQTIALVYQAIGEFYTNRPSSGRSGSVGGRSTQKRTSQVAAKSQASKRKASH